MAARYLLAVVLIAASATVVPATVVPATAARANTPPNPYTPTGAAWVDVPVEDRVYFEDFGKNYDDESIFYIGDDITCTVDSVVATGPFLTGIDLDATDCVDGSSVAVDPIDLATRAGSTPIGFPINFFGTSYTSAYPNINGGVFFEGPQKAYDRSLAWFANDLQTPAIYPLGVDLQYNKLESNFWIAQTTVNGAAALVFGWEKLYSCCSEEIETDDMSFQLLLIDAGSGDFNAWFNYESLAGLLQGSLAATATFDLSRGVVAGSNVVVAQDVSRFPTTCTPVNFGEFGTTTDSALITSLQGGVWAKVDSAARRAISLWSDSACTAPIPVNVLQDETASLAAYIELTVAPTTQYNSIGAGWSTYRAATGIIDATELLFNVPTSELTNDAANPLRTRSFNSATPGRFVLSQVAGSTFHVRRIFGADRFATSAEVANQYRPFEAGDGVVYVANGTNFPDALSAAPAAAVSGGPLLLTAPGSLPAVVRAAIERLHPDTIKVVGGTAAVSAAVYTELAGLAPNIQRLNGADRYETSRLVVTDAFGSSGSTGAFIATGANFPDALSASAAAGANGLPVILVNGAASSVDSPTASALSGHPWSRLSIAGGPAAVSASLETALGNLPSSSSVDRFSGPDRYTTSVAINQSFFVAPFSRTIYLAVGTSYADALSGAAYAGFDSSPLYVVPGNCVPQGVLNEIVRIGATEVVLFGGTAALRPAVEGLVPC